MIRIYFRWHYAPLCRLTLLTALLFSPLGLAQPGALLIGVTPELPDPYVVQAPEPELNKFQKRKDTKEADATLRTLPSKQQVWQEAVALLAKQSGLKLKLELPKSQLEFERKLAKGDYDFAYISPLQLVNFGQFPGYTAIAKRKAEPLRTVVLVKKFSDYSTFALMRDKPIAMGHPLDYASSVITRDALMRANFNIQPVFFANDQQAIQALFKDQAEGVAISGSTYDAASGELKGRTRVVWDSPGYTPWAFVVHPRIDSYTNLRMQRTLVAMIKYPQTTEMLNYMQVSNGFEAATDADWHDARNINIEALNQQVSASPMKPGDVVQ